MNIKDEYLSPADAGFEDHIIYPIKHLPPMQVGAIHQLALPDNKPHGGWLDYKVDENAFLSAGSTQWRQVHDDPATPAGFTKAFDYVAELAFQNAIDKGWHTDVSVGPSSIDVKHRKLMLIVGELAEVSEGLRVGNPPSKKIPEFTCEEEELADVILRCMDYARKEGLRLAEAVIAKHNMNTGRSHKHGGKLI